MYWCLCKCNKNISCCSFFLRACVPQFSAFIPTGYNQFFFLRYLLYVVRLSVLVDFVTQALQMLKEHPTYRDDEEIRGMYLFFRVRRQRGPVVDSTSYFQPDIPRASHILTTGWICFIVILSPFQALRWLGRHERVLKMQKWQGWKKGKGMPCLSLVLSQFLSFFFFYVRTFSIQRTRLSWSL